MFVRTLVKKIFCQQEAPLLSASAARTTLPLTHLYGFRERAYCVRSVNNSSCRRHRHGRHPDESLYPPIPQYPSYSSLRLADFLRVAGVHENPRKTVANRDEPRTLETSGKFVSRVCEIYLNRCPD